MTHPQFDRDKLQAFLEGTLSEQELHEFIERTEHDPDLRDALRELSHDDELVRRLREAFPIGEVLQEPYLTKALSLATQLLTGDETFIQPRLTEPEPGPAALDVGSNATTEPIAPATSHTPEFQHRQLREYVLAEKLGEGGMGAVYRATHTRLGKTVAVKLLSDRRLKNSDTVARFGREMKAVGKLDHPNIVRATDAGEVDGTHFLVMEYVQGKNLNTIVEERGPLAVPDACELIRQAAVGLQHAHEHGLVHRDLKPANLMLSLQGKRSVTEQTMTSVEGLVPDHVSSVALVRGATVKILDFGLARLQEDDTTGELTSDNHVMGTMDYMAPEQATDTHNVDITADVYSLGCTFYKLLTGRPPFGTPQYLTNTSKLAAHLIERVDSVKNLRPDVPDELESILVQMLAKNKSERFASPGEIAVLLRPFCDDADLARLLDRTSDSRLDSLTLPNAFRSPKNSDGISIENKNDVSCNRSRFSIPDDRSQKKRRTHKGPIKDLGKLLWTIIAVAAVAVLCGVGYAVKVSLGNQYGVLIVESSDPEIILTVDGNKVQSRERNQEGSSVFELMPGKHRVAVGSKDRDPLPMLTVTTPDGTEVATPDGTIEIKRNGVVKIVARVEPNRAELNNGKSVEPLPLDSLMIEIRAVSAWVIRHNGYVETTDGKYFNRVEDLPQSEFGLNSIAVNGKYVSVAESELIDQLKRLPSLSVRLSLFSVHLTDAGLEQLVLISALSKISYLELVGAEITAKGLVHLRRLPKLKILNLSQLRNLGNGSIGGLASIHLTHLQLSADDLADSHLKDIGTSIDLENLTLQSNPRLTAAGIPELCHISTLRRVDFAASPLGDNGLENLSCLANLHGIYLSDLKLSPQGMNHLRAFKNLDELGLFSFQSLKQYLERLPEVCPKLKELLIWNCNLGPSDLQVLKSIPMLNSITLRGVRLEQSNLKSIEELKRLTVLDIRETPIDKVDVDRLHAKFSECTIYSDFGVLEPTK